MRPVLVASLLVVSLFVPGAPGAPPGARAQERLLSTRVPCGRLAAVVASQESAVISTSTTTYDRYVGDSSL